jgi:hypothetical protein
VEGDPRNVVHKNLVLIRADSPRRSVHQGSVGTLVRATDFQKQRKLVLGKHPFANFFLFSSEVSGLTFIPTIVMGAIHRYRCAASSFRTS